MSQPSAHPHHVSQLLGPALGGIVHALADRADQTDAEYEARADEAWTLVQSFQPRDAIDLMLTGQFITMNELFADTARDILHGLPDGLKHRARSSAVAMGRLALTQAAEFERRGVQPYRAEATPQQRPIQAAKTPVVKPAEQPPIDAASMPAADSTTAPPPPVAVADGETAPPPAEETSWVEEPYQEWLDATPAMLAAEIATVAAENVPPPATHEGNGSTVALSEGILPPRQTEHPHAEAMAAAAD